MCAEQFARDAVAREVVRVGEIRLGAEPDRLDYRSRNAGCDRHRTVCGEFELRLVVRTHRADRDFLDPFGKRRLEAYGAAKRLSSMADLRCVRPHAERTNQ